MSLITRPAVRIEGIICKTKFKSKCREAGCVVQFFPKVFCLVLSGRLLTQGVWTIYGESDWKFSFASPLTASLPAAQVTSCYCTVQSVEMWFTDLSDEQAQASSQMDRHQRAGSDGFVGHCSGTGEACLLVCSGLTMPGNAVPSFSTSFWKHNSHIWAWWLHCM